MSAFMLETAEDLIGLTHFTHFMSRRLEPCARGTLENTLLLSKAPASQEL